MTTGDDGDAEPLRVPPWLTRGEPTGHRATPDPIEPEPVLLPPGPSYLDRQVSTVPAEVPPADRRRRWILAGVGAVLLLLPTLLVASLLDNKEKLASPPIGVLPTFSDVSLPGASFLPSASAAASVAATPSASAGPSASPSPTRVVVPPVATTRPPVRFGPVTIEAEAPGNALGGSAWVVQYAGASGGAIVRNIGNWNDRRGNGVLAFQGVTVPVNGSYTMTFFFVNIDNETTRTAVITVSGGDQQSVTVQGSSTCCASASVRVNLRKGSNTITFGNDAGHAPSLDRIVLSLP